MYTTLPAFAFKRQGEFVGGRARVDPTDPATGIPPQARGSVSLAAHGVFFETRNCLDGESFHCETRGSTLDTALHGPLAGVNT